MRIPSIEQRPAAWLAAILFLSWCVVSLVDWALPVQTGRRHAPAAAPVPPPVVPRRLDVIAPAALKSPPARSAPLVPLADVGHDEHDWLLSHSEAVCVALVVWAEARGEPLEGKVAVADLVLNRVDRRGDTVSPCQVTREPMQFVIGGRGAIARPLPADAAWRWCLFAAVSALRDREGIGAPRTHVDGTNGARCMVSPANMPHDVGTWPAWARGTPLAVIGGHAFFTCDY